MANQRAVANSNSDSTTASPSAVPLPTIITRSASDRPLQSTISSTESVNSKTAAVPPTQNGSISSSQPNPSSGNKTASSSNSPGLDGLSLSSTPAPPHVCLPPPDLANALRAVKDGNPGVVLHERHGSLGSDSPYAKSISSTAPGSPRIPPVRQNSGGTTPRVRPHATTLSIPGMTKSLVSPDGKIADRDVAAKLVVIMVGLPARGKSYITKKIRRYLSWQQHNTRIFNVGNRRRQTANAPSAPQQRRGTASDTVAQAADILRRDSQASRDASAQKEMPTLERVESVDQSAKFFDPHNAEAAKFRDQLALETLHELLDYLISGRGAVGILDATNSTIQRRQLLFDTIKAREPRLGVLFIESVCTNPNILEANMRLKLSGPDYKDKDPVQSLADFKERVKAYESAYEPLGDYEEDHGMQYIKMIDVGKKLTHFGLEGFLSNGIAHYLSSFNLSPRQIWITRHGQSNDNLQGLIGGNSELTERGHYYSLNLYRFITQKRKEWLVEQKNKMAQSSFPPLPGDKSPPYPDLNRELEEKNTCVWTSMLTRSIQTAEYFEADEDYDVKHWEMLNELNAGKFEGMSYEQIAREHTYEYIKRQRDKLGYIYPGVGGEGYLQVINRLRDMVREIERIKDHLVIIGHRSVCRVLLAYFMDLTTDDIADLDMPLGMIYAIEPKPYGIEFHAYKYNEEKAWFDELPGYKPQKTVDPNA
ncbi:hypothetical protein DL764_002937 [Monosporascus ibericus]|uniref:6-phosphofructo-2-kinase domain-containing protein n=1 Tax=Monosporascus ibericus TaxID=155417 RepID=A0A4Q4TIL4_9PEZI|nr:hypothetical protein DL764_002937 [Monosporascus ibericus]